MQSVTSNAVAEAFNGMEVTESGYTDLNTPNNGWYVKYKCGLIVEDFIVSHRVTFTALGNIYKYDTSLPLPVALKLNTKPVSVSASIESVRSSGIQGAWVGCTNENSDSNTRLYYQLLCYYGYSNAYITVRFHVVGFWK